MEKTTDLIAKLENAADTYASAREKASSDSLNHRGLAIQSFTPSLCIAAPLSALPWAKPQARARDGGVTPLAMQESGDRRWRDATGGL